MGTAFWFATLGAGSGGVFNPKDWTINAFYFPRSRILLVSI